MKLGLLVVLIVFSQLAIADRILQSVSDIRQTTDYSCGPSALTGVLSYYGKQATEEELILEMKTDPEVGTSIGEIVKAAERRGLTAIETENATIKDLEDAINDGQLAIILGQAWRGKLGWFRRPIPWEDEWDAGHYMVIIGTDKRNVYLEDPWIEGNRGFLTRKEFLQRWHGHSDSDVPTQGQVIFFKGTPDVTRPALDLDWIHVD